MKKLFITLTAIILEIGFFFQGMTCTAYAAEVSASSVKESQFVTGVYGTNNNGEEIVVALYNTGKKDIAFIIDGKEKFYGTYTMNPGQMEGGTNVQCYDVSGITFAYFEMDGGMYIMTDEGNIYTLENITAHEVEQLR